MFGQLEVFRLAGAMAGHAGQRQTVAAANVAQADTPGYRARAVEPFEEVVATDGFAMRSTRSGHLHGPSADREARIVIAEGPASPDGNTVSLESEMFEAARAMSDHNRALAIYRNGLSVLRASLGGR
jgi:flagellar basal-body rod protein FlgB